MPQDGSVAVGFGRSRWRHRTYRQWLLSVLASLFAMTAGADPCTPDQLGKFVGQWSARGTVQPNPDAQREPIRCRIVFQAVDATRIETSGRCATGSETRDVIGWLGCDGRKFVGPLFFASGEAPPTFIRDISQPGRIVLVLEALDPTTQALERYRLTATSSTPDTMVMRFTRGTWTAMTLRYRREPA